MADTNNVPDSSAAEVIAEVAEPEQPTPTLPANGEASAEPVAESTDTTEVTEGALVTEGTEEAEADADANGTAPVREDERKLFVGGMSRETTESDIKEYFAKFGEVENINLKIDPTTGVSRGFAFVVYKAGDSIDKALAVAEHTIKAKKVEVNRAKARQGKIFVGGLAPEVTEETIREYFGKFGKITELEMPFDKMKNQRKGFIFVTYENEDAMKEILKNPRQTIGEKEVEIKKATPKIDGPVRGGMRGAPRGRGGGFVPRGGRGRGGGGGWGGQEWGGGYGGGYGGYGGQGGYDDGYGGGYGYNSGGYGGYGGGYGGGNYAQQGQYGPQKTRGGGRGRGGGQRYTPYNRR